MHRRIPPYLGVVLLCGALTLFATVASAAQVTGHVRTTGGKPLPYAPVKLTPVDTDTVAPTGVHADSTGRFVLDGIAPGIYEAEVRYVGYVPWEQTIAVRDGTQQLAVRLVERTIRSDDIVVTASRRPEATSAVSASVDVLSQESIAARGAHTLDQALETAEGVQTYRSHGVATNAISIRGSSDVLGGGVGNRVLLLIDGRPALNADSGGPSWSLIPFGMVDHVEIVKGAFSALYGSSAMGGVINMITREPTAQPQTTVQGRAGFYEKPPEWMRYRNGAATFDGVDVLHSNTVGKTGYVVLVSRDDSEGYRESSDYNVWQTYGKITRDIGESARLWALVGGGRSHSGYPHRWLSIAEPLHVPVEKRDDRQNKTWWSADLNGKTLDPTDAIWEGGVFAYGNGSVTVQEPGESGSEVQSVRVGARASWQRGLGDRVTQTFGGDVALDNVDSDSILYGNRSAQSGAIYSLTEIALPARARMDLGVRYDVFSYPNRDLEHEVNPKAGISVPVGDTFTIRGSVGRAFRSPSIAERYLILEPAGGTEFAPNDDIRPETVVSYEMGISHEIAPILRIDVSGFVNDYDDWIYWHELPVDPETGAYRFQVANLLKVRMSGIDAHARLSPIPGFELNADYLYLRAKDRTPGRTDDELPYRPHHTFATTAIFTHGHLHTSVTTRMRSSVTETVFSAYRYDAPDAYVVTDVRAQYDVRSWWSIGLTIDNVFNAQYEEMARYRLPGRSYAVSTRVTL